MVDDATGADDWDDPPVDSGGSFEWLQFVASAAGAALAGSYAVTWVAITGPTLTEAEGTTISARELAVLPELVAAVGVLAVGLSLWRWTRPIHVSVLVLGLAGTGLTLFVWFFLRSDADAIQIGPHGGPPSSFDPAVGVLVALVGSLALVGAGFVAVLQTLDAGRDSSSPE